MGKKKDKPKSKCCDDRPRCKRCPIRMLSEGRLAPADARAIFAKARNKKIATKAAKRSEITYPDAA